MYEKYKYKTLIYLLFIEKKKSKEKKNKQNMNRMYQFVSHFNPIHEVMYERPIQTIEKPPSSASSRIFNITKEEQFSNYQQHPIEHVQPKKQPSPIKQHMEIQTEESEKKIHCPRFDEYKAYLYHLQHGFPVKDYRNYIPNSKRSSKVNRKPEQRVSSIKTTVLQPHNNPYNAHSTLNRLSAMNNSLYHNLLKSESLLRPKYSSLLLAGN